MKTADLHHLKATHGWIELGNYSEAENEWLEITPAGREHPDSLKALLHIYVNTEQWDYARNVAEKLTNAKPDEATNWLSLAHASRYSTGGSVLLAWEILSDVADKFSDVPNFLYNRACYTCQIGDNKNALFILEKAFDHSKDPKALKTQALEEPELEPLWRDISEI